MQLFLKKPNVFPKMIDRMAIVVVPGNRQQAKGVPTCNQQYTEGDVSFSSPRVVLYPHHMTAGEVITVKAGEGLKEARPKLAA